jgi:hypothetical protein
MSDINLSLVNPLESCAGTLDGFISSRLMAAYQLDDEHVIHVVRDHTEGHREFWHYVLERNGTVVFEGRDFSTGTRHTYGEAARGVLGFLTLCEGDTEAGYFRHYTLSQRAWRDECAEDLQMFGMEPDED